MPDLRIKFNIFVYSSGAITSLWSGDYGLVVAPLLYIKLIN